MVIRLDGQIVKRSMNLRGIMDYARDVSAVTVLHIFKNEDGSGYAHIAFDNGAEADVNFADYSVLKHWAERRLTVNRNFTGADYQYQ